MILDLGNWSFEVRAWVTRDCASYKTWDYRSRLPTRFPFLPVWVPGVAQHSQLKHGWCQPPKNFEYAVTHSSHVA
jgi:hypothetical protein